MEFELATFRSVLRSGNHYATEDDQFTTLVYTVPYFVRRRDTGRQTLAVRTHREISVEPRTAHLTVDL